MTTIVQYTTGNVFSVQKQIERCGVSVRVSSDPSDILSADRLILPGVGHFGRAMDHLRKTGLDKVLAEAVLEHKKPILGICLGMQLMTQGSEEGGTEGLGWFDCRTERLQVSDPYAFKIPHTGWNTIEHSGKHPLLNGVPSGSEVYFVHAYGVLQAPTEQILTTTSYDQAFVSALHRESIIGMQFHPEKSHDTGLQIFQNFLYL
jgi:glutamine amidotransferase